MAKLTLYPRPGLGSIDSANPGAESTTGTGWTVGTNTPTKYKLLGIGEERGTSGWTSTALPNEAPIPGFDTLISDAPFTGKFAAEAWAAVLKVIAVTQGGSQDGAASVRLWKTKDGENFTALTGPVSLSTVTDLATGASQETSGSLEPGAFELEEEFLALQIAWKITGAGASSTCDVLLREGGGVTLTTADFEEEEPPPPEEVSRWEFDETSGTTATDSVGSNDGTYVNATLGKPSIIPYIPEAVTVLLGEGAYIQVPDDASLRFSNGLGFRLWYDVTDSGVLYAREDNCVLTLGSNGELTFAFRDPEGEWHEASTAEGALEVGKHSIEVAYDRSHIRIYIDGAEAVSGEATAKVRGSEGDTWIGVQPGGEFQFCHGRYQRLVVYGGPRSAEEILATYEEESIEKWLDVIGDFETGDFSQFWEVQANEDRATVVESPVAQGKYAGHFEVREEDPEVEGPGGHRAEIIPDRFFYNGDDRYFRGLINLQQVDWAHWTIVFQLHDEGTGSPPVCGFLIEDEGSKRFRIQKGDSKAVYFDIPAIEGRYFEWALHVVFGAKGSLRLWINGELIGEVTEIDTLGNEPCNFKAGIYRSSEAKGTTELLHDDLRITEEFFSDPPILSVITGAASGIGPVRATLNGTVHPGPDLPATYYFEYGETEAYGSTTPKVEDIEDLQGVAAEVVGLKPATTYHFRLRAENAEGEVAGEDATFSTVEPTAFKPIDRPPLELDVEVETPDAVYRLPCDSRIASKRPRGMRFSTQRGDGFGPGGCSFQRPILKDYPDISPLDTWRFVGRNGDIAYESRLQSRPSGNDPSQQLDVNLVGWMTYLTGRKVAALIVDRRLSGWGGPSMARRKRILELGRSLEASVDSGFRDSGSLAAGLAFTINRLNEVYAATGEAWFYAGGEAIAELLYDYKQISTWGAPDPDWTNSGHLCKDDVAAEGVDSGTNHQRVDASGQSVVATTDDRLYALIQNRRAATVTGDFANVDSWLNLAVLGNHGLTKRGSAPEQGFWLSDIIRYLLERYYPKIDTSGIQTNTYPVKQAAWHDSKADGHQVIEQLNGLAGWETNVWEGRRYHFHPADLTKYDWVIRTTDPGVRVLFEGPSIEHFANGIEVTFTDFYGVTHSLYPSDHAELRDEDDSNPANRHGEALWTSVEVPWPCFLGEALQYGRAALADFNRPKRPGRYRIQGGYIRDAAGHWHQGWKPRSSQTLGILDHPDDRPRLITATPSWDQESKTLEVAVDGAPPSLTAMVARQQRAREAANL